MGLGSQMYAFTALECFKLRNCWVLNLPSDNFSLWPEPKGCQSCCTSALPYLASLALHLLFSVKNDVLPNCLWFGICTHRSNLENDSGTSESNLFDLNFSNNVWFKAPSPTQKSILVQVHSNRMKFSGYVGTVVERL